MKKFKQKLFWQKGGGEIIGFAYVLPFIVMLICCIIAAAQISITNQRLSYTAYNACRSAVVSVDETTAQQRG
jgi:Flp pilus assembly protein TadG